MAQITWPSTLPQAPLARSFREQPGRNVVTTEMEVGPPKRRPRSTATVKRFSMTFLMTGDEVDIFETFYQDTAKQGTIPFDFTHPRTQQTIELSIADDPIYRTVDGLNYQVTVRLEQAP